MTDRISIEAQASGGGGGPDSISEIRARSYVGYTSQRGWQPAINIYESDESFFICVELAGVKAGDIDVRTEKSALHVSGIRPDPRPRGEHHSLCIHLMEVQSGEFEREIRIPPNVAAERIEATYREGFLWISLPKINR
jgi:HSP20 family protein